MVAALVIFSVSNADAKDRFTLVSGKSRLVKVEGNVSVYRMRVAIKRVRSFEVGLAESSCRKTRLGEKCEWTAYTPRAIYRTCKMEKESLTCRSLMRTLNEANTARRSGGSSPSESSSGSSDSSYSGGRSAPLPPVYGSRDGDDERASYDENGEVSYGDYDGPDSHGGGPF